MLIPYLIDELYRTIALAAAQFVVVLAKLGCRSILLPTKLFEGLLSNSRS